MHTHINSIHSFTLCLSVKQCSKGFVRVILVLAGMNQRRIRVINILRIINIDPKMNRITRDSMLVCAVIILLLGCVQAKQWFHDVKATSLTPEVTSFWEYSRRQLKR